MWGLVVVDNDKMNGLNAGESICGICMCRIKDNTLFTNLTDKEIDVFKDVVTTSSHKKKEVIFMEDDECLGLYIVRMGRVKLIRSSRDGREHIIKILTPGDLLGLEVFCDADTYANSSVVMEDASLCFVRKADFFTILESAPEVSRKIMMALGRELHQAYEKIGNLGLKNAKENLAHLLHSLAIEYGSRSGGGVRLHLTLSRLEIAEMLGITQETSIRLLKVFKEEGIIKIERKEIIILSMDKLAAVGGVK
jgi:CRP/FNR family transcriptional regulator